MILKLLFARLSFLGLSFLVLAFLSLTVSIASAPPAAAETYEDLVRSAWLDSKTLQGQAIACSDLDLMSFQEDVEAWILEQIGALYSLKWLADGGVLFEAALERPCDREAADRVGERIVEAAKEIRARAGERELDEVEKTLEDIRRQLRE